MSLISVYYWSIYMSAELHRYTLLFCGESLKLCRPISNLTLTIFVLKFHYNLICFKYAVAKKEVVINIFFLVKWCSWFSNSYGVHLVWYSVIIMCFSEVKNNSRRIGGNLLAINKVDEKFAITYIFKC